MSEASPSAAGLPADYSDSTAGGENAAFIAWLNADRSALAGRKR